MHRFYRSLTPLFICLLMSADPMLAKGTDLNKPVYATFETSLTKCNNQEYEAALQLAKQIRQQYPESPAGIFAQVIAYQTLMETFRISTYQSRLDSLLGFAVKISKKSLKRDKRNGLNYFYLAIAYGARSATFARRGKWLEALRDGSRIKANLERAIKYSPDFYDAYYGIGTYNYWVSAKAKILRVFGDHRQQGIEQVKMATEKARFLKTNALYGLSSIYFNEQRYEEAAQLCEQIDELYPHNPTGFYRAGRTYQRLGKWQEAKNEFTEVLKILQEAPYQSISYQVDCLYQLARCEQALGNIRQSKTTCEEALALAKKCDFSKELNGPFEKYEDVLEELNDFYAELQPNVK